MNVRSYTDAAQRGGVENVAIRRRAARGWPSFRVPHKADLGAQTRFYAETAVPHKADLAPNPLPVISRLVPCGPIP